jgi:hypothetical protein
MTSDIKDFITLCRRDGDTTLLNQRPRPPLAELDRRHHELFSAPSLRMKGSSPRR